MLQIDPQLLLGEPDSGRASAPRHPLTPAAGIDLASARWDVEVLMCHHLAAVGHHRAARDQLILVRRLLTLVYAVLAAEQIDPQVRWRVIATVFTRYRPAWHSRPSPDQDTNG